MMVQGLTEKVALVTGTARGIGRAPNGSSATCKKTQKGLDLSTDDVYTVCRRKNRTD